MRVFAIQKRRMILQKLKTTLGSDMKKKTVKPRNRKAQDATLINIDALKKRMKKLEVLVAHLLKHTHC